jgi:hypothetical protein
MKRPARRPDLPGQLLFQWPDESPIPGPPCLACAGPTRIVEGIGPDRRSKIECQDPACAVWRWAIPVRQHWRRQTPRGVR